MHTEKELMWTASSTDHLVDDQWIDFKEEAYTLPDGVKSLPYYSYSRKDYVVILASDPEGNYLCVRQFRHGLGAITNEFPAGGIESGLSEYAHTGKDPAYMDKALHAAKRELLEETGYESDQWNHLITVPSSATMADNYAFLFEAKNCRKVADQHLDDVEFLDVDVRTPEEIDDLIAQENFHQAVHIMGWEMVKNKREGKGL